MPVRDENGEVTGWCGTNTDIEDRKRIEDDLSRSKAILDETQRITRCGSMGLNISTEDRGGGIDSEIADRLFAPFFTTKSEGMGMGLAICHSIIAAHGGQLWFTRAEVGTVFHFSLPLG